MKTRTSQAATGAPVVGELESRLDSLRNTIRRTTFIDGAAFAVRLACLCLIVAFGIDMFWDAPRGVRIGLLLATGAAVAVVVFQRVIRPAIRPIGHDELAALVETSHPEMEERLLSSLELARSADRESVKGSPMMREMLLRETEQAVRDVEFEEVVDSSRAVRQTVIACVTFLVVLCPFVVLQEGYGNLWARFFNPWGNYAHGTTLTLDVQPGDAVVPRGEDVPITAVPQFRFAKSKLMTGGRVRWIDDEGESEFRDLKPAAADQQSYTAMIPQVSRGLTYRVESDQGASREYRVEVVDRPAMTGLTVDVQPPAYCGKAAQRIDGLVGETSVFERSKLKFTATFNKPVAEVRWLWLDDVRHKYDGKPLEARGRDRLKSASLSGLQFARDDAQLMSVDADGLSASWELTADREGSFEIVLLDSDGIQNRHEPGRSFRILRDAAPTIAWADNETHPTAKPDDVVGFDVAATDDIGLGAVELHYSVLPHRTQAGVLKTDSSVLGGPQFDTRFPIDLRKLSAPEGALIAVKARAADERPVPGPSEAWTSERVIAITRDAAAFGSSELNQRHQRIRDLLAALRQEASAREGEAAALKQQAKDAQQKGLQEQVFKSETDQLAVRGEQLKERLQQTAAEFQREGMMATLSPKLGEIADKNVGPAVKETEKARDAVAESRAPALQKAEQELGEATQKLTQVEQRFEELAKLEKDLLELNRIADKTERLANDVADFEQHRKELAQKEGASPQEKEQASVAQKTLESQRKQLQQEQRDLSKNLQDVLNRRPEVVEAARADLIERLKNLGQRAEQLAEKEERLSQAMKQAGQDNANSLKNEAEHQQQLREQVKDLAAQVAAEQRQRLVARPDLSKVNEAAEQLQKGNPQAAAEAQRKAAEELEQFARALEQNRELPADPQKAAEALAKRQQEIRDQLDEALKQSKEEKAPPPAEELKRLAAEQAALQSAAAQLEVPVSNESRREEALKEGAKALAELLSDKPEQALGPADRAKSKLEQLARDVGTPEDRVKRLSRDADQLRRQQEAIARELEKKREDDRASGRKPAAEPQSLADQLRKQEDVARKAATMDVAGAPNPSRASEKQADAILAAAEALQKAQSGNAEEAAPAARKAEQALSELEKALKNEPTTAEQLERLVKEQRELNAGAQEALKANDAKSIDQARGRQQKQADQLQKLDVPVAEGLAKDAKEKATTAAKELAAAKGEENRRPAAEQAVNDAGEALERLASAMRPSGSPSEQARQLATEQQQRARQAAEQANDPLKPQDQAQPGPQMAAAKQALDQLAAPGAPDQKQSAAKALEAARQSGQKVSEARRAQPAEATEPTPELKTAVDENAAKQQAAAEALSQLADQLGRPETQQALSQGQQQAAQLADAAQNPRREALEATARAASQLAEEQEKLREKTEPLVDGLADKGQQRAQMDAARAAQQKLAEQMESLKPAADPLARAEAQTHARAAEKALAAGDPQKATAEQAAAQQSLEQLAESAQGQQAQLASKSQPAGEPGAAPQSSKPESPNAEKTPSTSPQEQSPSPTPAEKLAQQARALAQQQRQAADQLMQAQPDANQLASAADANRSAPTQGQPSSNPPPPSSKLDEQTKLPMSPDSATGRGGESSPQSSGSDATQGRGPTNRPRPPSDRSDQSPMKSESPKAGEPMSEQPMSAQPMPGEPMPQRPMSGQPMSGQLPMTDQPMPDQPMPMSEPPMPGQPMSRQPMPGQPMSGQPMSGQPMGGQPMNGQPMSGQPATGQPMSGQPMPGQGAPTPGATPSSGPPQPGVPGSNPGGTEPGASSPGGTIPSPMGQPSATGQPSSQGQPSSAGQPAAGSQPQPRQPSQGQSPSAEPGMPGSQPSQGQPDSQGQPSSTARRPGQPGSQGQPSSGGQQPGEPSPGSPMSGAQGGQPARGPQGNEARTPAESARDAVAAQHQVSQQLANAALEAAAQAQGTPLAEAASKMAKSAAQASESASVGATSQAAQEGRALAQQAGELAKQLEENPVAQGGPQPELAGRMRDLAQQQEQASGQLSQVGQNQATRNAAQSQGQQQLKQETQQLEKDFSELSEQLKAQPVDRKRQSEQARDARTRSEGASKEMQHAMQTARQGDSAEAAEAARSAAEELRKAARMAVEERAFEPEKSPNNPVPNETGSQVADAARELQKAGEMLSENQQPMGSDQQSGKPDGKKSKTDASQQAAQPNQKQQGQQQSKGQMQPDDGGNEGLAEGQEEAPPQASEMLKQGAHSLRKAANQLKLRPGKSDDRGQEGGEQGESQPSSGQQKQGSASGANEQARIVDVEAHLEKLSTRNWGELPGKLQTEILQSTRRRPDGDYAPLIRRYFDAISKSQGTSVDRRED